MDRFGALLGDYFPVAFLLVGLLVVLRRKSRIGNINLKNAWFVFISIVILSCVDAIERMCSWHESLVGLRTLTSVLGYWLRPIVCLCFLSLSVNVWKKKNFWFWIPALVNIAVFSTAFFAKWTFWFDEEYSFHRGPLGYVVFAVSYFYVICILITTVRTFRSGGRNQSMIMLIGAIGVVVASVLEALGLAQVILNPAILVAVLLYYLYVFIEVTAHDPGTQLFNRQTFYEDITVYKKRIDAVISVDMNGLKMINDTQGHKAGDDALNNLADVLKKYADGTHYAYRVGGDEFYMLCLDTNERLVEELVGNIILDMGKSGVSVATGFAMITKENDIDAALDEADVKMYADKAHYYQATNHDRRGDYRIQQEKED